MAIQQLLASYGALSGGDPNYANVQSLLRFNGTNGSTTYTDEKGRTWTADNTAPTISTAQSKFGGSSLRLQTSGNIKTAYDTGLQFPGDFTVEFWHYLLSRASSFPALFSNYNVYAANGGMALFAGHSGGNINKYQLAFNANFPFIQTTNDILYNQWVHVALTRSGSTWRLFINGTQDGTATSSTTVTGTANNWWLGASGDSVTTTRIDGYIDDWRITKGVARYTSNFTPPTAEFPNF